MTAGPRRPHTTTYQPSYAALIELPQSDHFFYESMLNCLGGCLGFLGSVPCCPMTNPYRTVRQGDVGLVSRFGKYYRSVDPGLYQINIMTESLRVVDIRIQVEDIPAQVSIFYLSLCLCVWVSLYYSFVLINSLIFY